MTLKSMQILRIAGGLAVGLWGLSKILFVQDWVAPYEGIFYGSLPGNAALLVYVLGLVQLVLAIAITLDLYRRFAAWVAVGFSGVNLISTFFAFLKPNSPVLELPAPMGIKLVWFFFDPLVILLLLVGVALLPSSTGRRTASEAAELSAVGGDRR